MKQLVLLFNTLFLVSCSQFSEPQGSGRGDSITQKNAADANLEANFASIKSNIIDKKCLSCHKADSKSDAKDIPFETESQVVDGSSDLGPLVVPGRPAESLLYRSIVGDESIRGRAKIMPPKDSVHAAVTAAEQHVIAAWISGVAVKKTEPSPAPTELQKKPEPQTQAPVEPVPATEPAPVAQMPAPVPADPTAHVGPPPSAELPSVVDFALIKTEILEKKCMICHKADGKADELVFNTRDELVALTNSFGQNFVIIGKPDESLLYLSLIKDETIRKDVRLMPPKKDVVAGKVADVTLKDVALINKWITEGAK